MDISVTDLTSSAYLYLRTPGPGKYEIKTGNCLDGEYCVWNLEKCENITFEVSLLDKDDNELVPNEQAIYEIETDMMPVKLSIQTSGSIMDEGISDLYYQRKDSEGGRFQIIEKRLGKWIKEVELPEQKGEYSYEICLEAGGSRESKEITISYGSCQDVEEENKLVFQWLKYDLKNDKISWENMRKEKIEVYINSNIIIPGTSDETAALGEDLTIVFHESGEYLVNVRRNGCTVRKIKYKVIGPWIPKKALSVCAVLLALALILAVIFRKKQR